MARPIGRRAAELGTAMNQATPTELTLMPSKHARGTVILPGSKSLSIRALLLAALAQGTTELANVLDSEDTQVMRAALQALGVQIEIAGQHRIRVTGAAPFTAQQADLFVGNSGLSIRTLAAALARMPGRYRLHGVARMHERPIGDLIESIAAFGANVTYEGQPGYPPLVIQGNTRGAVPVIHVKGNASSQYLTGLLQIAPLASGHQDVVIVVEGALISKPYVDMTLALMYCFGVKVQREGYARFTVPRGSRYTSPGQYVVEGDASSASYFLAAGLLGKGPVRVVGAGADSLQGDVRFADFLASVGAHVQRGPDWIEVSGTLPVQAFDQDFNHIPDAAMTAAVLALFANGPCMLRNIASWRVKETDRLAAMATELQRCGAHVREGADWLQVTPPAQLRSARIATYDDHRMAMSFALAAFGGASVTILEPGCVAKTFPAFFDVFQQIVQAS
jgi:3-phosphoshikimate 1-carboxyvinyltransferase